MQGATGKHQDKAQQYTVPQAAESSQWVLHLSKQVHHPPFHPLFRYGTYNQAI